MVEGLGFDLVDLNLGCPAKKVVKCNGGSGLLKDLPAIGKIFEAVRAAVTIPFTVKFRAGWNDEEHRLRRTGQDGGRLRAMRGGTACSHARTGLQRTGALGVDRGGQRRGEDSGDWEWRYPHAGGCLRHGGADGMRCGDDRADGAVESVDLSADRAVLQRHEAT